MQFHRACRDQHQHFARLRPNPGANDNELHAAAREGGQGLLKIRNHGQRPDFATSGRNRAIKRVALTSCWARCFVLSRRFFSTNEKSISRFENLQHRIQRLGRGPGHSFEGLWRVVRFIRLHDQILKPPSFARNARFEIVWRP